MVAVPIFDPSGQVDASRLLIPTWSSEQPSRPVAADGLTDTPSGNCTTAFFSEAAANGPGSSSPPCGSEMSTSSPDAESACDEVGVTDTDASNGTWSHPV